MGINIGGRLRTVGPAACCRSHGRPRGKGGSAGASCCACCALSGPIGRRCIAALLLMLIASGAGLLAPYLTKVAIDENIAASDVPGLLIRTSALLAGTLTAIYLASAGQSYILSWVGQKVLATLRGQLFRHLQALSVPYHDRTSSASPSRA